MFPWQNNQGQQPAAPVAPVFQPTMTPPQPAAPRSVYDGIETVEINGGYGRSLSVGQHMLRIKAIKENSSKKKANTVYFIVEFELLSTTAPNYRARQGDVEGETVSWVVDMGQMSAQGNLKQFFLELKRSIAAVAPQDWLTALQGAGFDVGFGNISVSEIMFAKGPAQPLAGIPIYCECKEVETRSGGKFTKHYYRAVDANLQILAAAQ